MSTQILQRLSISLSRVRNIWIDIFELIKHKIAQATTSSEWNIPLCVPIVKISFRSSAVAFKELKILMFIKIPP